MADHGEVEYATATGNDYAEHEGTYHHFVKLTEVGIATVIAIVVGLALVGVKDAILAGTLIEIAAFIACVIGLGTTVGWKAPTLVAVIALAALAFV